MSPARSCGTRENGTWAPSLNFGGCGFAAAGLDHGWRSTRWPGNRTDPSCCPHRAQSRRNRRWARTGRGRRARSPSSSAPLNDGPLKCRAVPSDPDHRASVTPGSHAARGKRCARRLQRRRFRPHPRRYAQRRHAPLAGRRGHGKRRPQAVAVPAHRKRTPASRSRLS